MSSDGIHFREPVPGFKVIARGEAGAWDDTALLQGHAFVNDGERTMIWYSHWDTGGGLKTMDIGLATLRRDGFGYLSRMFEASDAHFITDTFTAGKNTRLSINADGMAPGAKLVVQDGGYAVDNCGDIPALGCPIVDLTPYFDQSYQQGARFQEQHRCRSTCITFT